MSGTLLDLEHVLNNSQYTRMLIFSPHKSFCEVGVLDHEKKVFIVYLQNKAQIKLLIFGDDHRNNFKNNKLTLKEKS